MHWTYVARSHVELNCPALGITDERADRAWIMLQKCLGGHYRECPLSRRTVWSSFGFAEISPKSISRVHPVASETHDRFWRDRGGVGSGRLLQLEVEELKPVLGRRRGASIVADVPDIPI